MKSELEKLIELQKTDTNIRRLKKAIETAEQRRADIEQEFEQHAFSIREIQNKRDEAREKRAELEKEIITNKTYIDRADRNLKAAKDQKQYETAMRELDNLQKQVGKLETEVLEKMTEIEEVEKILEERADEVNSLESNRETALSDFDRTLAENKEEFASETEKRAEVFDTLPAQMASVYNRLAQRSRDGIAVAEVINGSCSACFMSLRPQMQVELKTSDQIITCESCARILYIASEAKTAVQES
ncbi:MAG: C4-type zinc ribbon domain-containing protein [Pyrinomonadaceae bacterium]